jgi:hypothetical protein
VLDKPSICCGVRRRRLSARYCRIQAHREHIRYEVIRAFVFMLRGYGTIWPAARSAKLCSTLLRGTSIPSNIGFYALSSPDDPRRTRMNWTRGPTIPD